MKKLVFFCLILITGLSYGQRYSSPNRYSNPQPSRAYGRNPAPQYRPNRPNAGSLYNPYTAQAAYYQTFNQQMTPVYNATRQVQRVANGAVNIGGYFGGESGQAVRQGYNAGQRYIGTRTINLPRRYNPR